MFRSCYGLGTERGLGLACIRGYPERAEFSSKNFTPSDLSVAELRPLTKSVPYSAGLVGVIALSFLSWMSFKSVVISSRVFPKR